MDARDWIAEANEDALFCDPQDYDAALVGYVERFGQPPLALYDKEKFLAIMQEGDGMTAEDAEEFFYYNTVGAWAGENTPAFATFITPHEQPKVSTGGPI